MEEFLGVQSLSTATQINFSKMLAGDHLIRSLRVQLAEFVFSSSSQSAGAGSGGEPSSSSGASSRMRLASGLSGAPTAWLDHLDHPAVSPPGAAAGGAAADSPAAGGAAAGALSAGAGVTSKKKKKIRKRTRGI